MENNKKKKLLKISGLIGLFLLIFGLSYALFTVTLNGTKKVKISTGRLELQLLDKNNNPIYITEENNTTSYEINLDNQVPVSDEDGMRQEGFIFKLKNTGNISANYTIYLDDVELEDGEDRMLDSSLRYSLIKNTSDDYAEDLTNIGSNPNRKLDIGYLKSNEENTYTFKIWVKETANEEAMNKVFHATLRVVGSQKVKGFANGTLASALYGDGEISSITSVNNGFVAEEDSGLYKYTDSFETETYVFRGEVENNYVSFAGQLWKAVRIQSDGTVKLMRAMPVDYQTDESVTSVYEYWMGFDGKDSYPNFGVPYTSAAWNSITEDDIIYKGSNIEKYINAWYNGVMKNYDSKIAMNPYCSDRTEVQNSNYITYGVANRLSIVDGKEKVTPSVSCRTEDTVYAKAALITADEYILAGCWYNGFTYSTPDTTIKFYLIDDLNINPIGWTMSPIDISLTPSVYATDGDCSDNPEAALYVYPMITLKADVTIASGNGSLQTPYVIN